MKCSVNPWTMEGTRECSQRPLVINLVTFGTLSVRLSGRPCLDIATVPLVNTLVSHQRVKYGVNGYTLASCDWKVIFLTVQNRSYITAMVCNGANMVDYRTTVSTRITHYISEVACSHIDRISLRLQYANLLTIWQVPSADLTYDITHT
jgi:hypothetical protein